MLLCGDDEEAPRKFFNTSVESVGVGKVLFGEALAEGSAAAFFKLIEQFHTQARHVPAT